MASPIPTQVPQGRVVSIGIPDSEDIPRLVYAAPYFTQVPLAELIEPSVIEAVNAVLPSLVPPYVDGAVQAGIQAQAVLLVGSTMTGPLFLNPVMPTADAQAATKAYVDTMLSTAGIPEVPPVPVGQIWGRETGQWVAISQTQGTFLPLAGGTMQGNINLSGNTVTNMAAVPAMPNGAAPAQWVLNQIASVSLYQGTWNADTNVPDLTQLSTHVNAYTWIALTTAPAGVVVGAAIPGLQGTTVFNGDTIIYSTVEGGFKAIHGGGITLPEADGRYVQLAGSQMSGALLLNANASQPMQATTFQQLEAAVASVVSPDAPADGQAYLRVGVGTNRWVPGLPLAGGILTGALTLSGNAALPLNAVPLQQVQSLVTAGTTGLLPLAGGTMTGPMTLSGNATVNLNPVPLQQVNAMLATYAPLQNPSFTGTVTLPGNAASALQAVPLQQLTSTLAGYLPLAGGTLTGPLVLPNGTSAAPALNFNGNGGFYVSAANVVSFTQALAVTGNLSTSGSLGATGSVTGGAGSSLGGVTFGGTGVGINMGAQPLTTTGTILATQVNPTTDNANNCGIPGRAWFQVASYNFVQQSDISTKSNIVDYAAGVSQAAQLLPKTFTYTNDATARTHLGFVAQDIQNVIPDAVVTMEGTPLLSLDMTAIVAVLANAVKQMISRIAALESNANITPSAAQTA